MNDRPQRIKRFKETIWKYYRANRRRFPWRETKNPYRILVSEIMLQQTQTGRVAQKYESFLKQFPNFQALAHSSVADVLRAWQGLGYNRRALLLKRLSTIIVKEHGGRLPSEPEELEALPGIGKATAGAVAAFAFNKPVPFIETNIRRAFIHFFFGKNRSVDDRDIMALVEKTLAQENPREWFSALMDYGAMLGKMKTNPNRKSARYQRQPKFRGSVREMRGKLIRELLNGGPQERNILLNKFSPEKARAAKAIAALEKEGFILRKQNTIHVAS